MNIGFDAYKVSAINNPNKDCVQVTFHSTENPDVTTKHFIIFEQQVKYMIVDEHKKFKRVKIYFRGDESSTHIDFNEDQDELLEKFLKSVYNR